MYLLQFEVISVERHEVKTEMAIFATRLSLGDALQIVADGVDAKFDEISYAAPRFNLVSVQEVPGISDHLLEKFGVREIIQIEEGSGG